MPWCPLLACSGASIAKPRMSEIAWASMSGESEAGIARTLPNQAIVAAWPSVYVGGSSVNGTTSHAPRSTRQWAKTWP